MNSEQFVTRAFVMTQPEAFHSLEYYIFSEQDSNNQTIFGLIINQSGNSQAIAKTRPLFTDKETAVDLCNTYAKNFVFPISLEELIEDLPSFN